MKPSKKNGYSQNPQLRFSPAAWAKLLYLRDYGPTEVGGFGIAPAEDLLYVQEVRLVRQLCTSVSVRFDDGAVADFFDEQVDAGRRPEQFARLWLHTHPGNCPLPSATDERTLARVFGAADWAVMFIVAQEGPTYARLRFNVGPGGAAELGVAVDYGRPFAASDHANWEAEYQANVAPALPWENEFPLSALQDFLEGGDFFGEDKFLGADPFSGEEYVEPVPSHDDF